MSIVFGKLLMTGICVLVLLVGIRSIKMTKPSLRLQAILQLAPINICLLIVLIGVLVDRDLIALAGFVLLIIVYGAQYFLRLPPGYFATRKLLKAGDKRGALERVNKAIEKHPKSVEAYYLRSMVYLSQGQSAEAKSDIAKIKDLKPDSVLNALANGQIFYLQGEYSEAKECFTRACRSGSDQLCLGQLSYRLGEYDDAIEVLKMAILGRLSGEQKLLVYFYLACSLERLGRIKEANTVFSDMKRYARNLDKLKQHYGHWPPEYPEMQVMQQDLVKIEELLVSV